MFGWFQPHCPLNTAEKAWLELRMNWLAAKLGRQRLLDAKVMLPTPEFFPDMLDGSPQDAAKVLGRLCRHLGLDAGEILLDVWNDQEMEGALGLYIQGHPSRILVNESELRDSESLVATLSHELSHHLLLGGGLLTENNQDLERLTDLLPVFLGIGIFSGNAVLRESHWREGRSSGWSIQKKGYLPGRMFAYGFALFAHARAEQKPKWAGYLRHDLSEPFWQGLRFLNKTGDTLFGETLNLRELSLDQLAERLQSPSATIRYVALWELEERGAEAAAAAQALGEIAAEPETVLFDLRVLLHDSDDAVRSAATMAIGCFGAAAARLSSELWPILKEGLLQCDYSRFGPAIYSLRRIIPSPRETIQSFVKGFDREMRIVALQTLDEELPLEQTSPLHLP